MASKNVVFISYSDATFTVKAFAPGSDTVVATASSVSPGTNFPERYTAAFSDLAEGTYHLQIKDADDNVSYEVVVIGGSTTNYVESALPPSVNAAIVSQLNTKLSQRGVV